MADRTPTEALARALWERDPDPDHPCYVAWDDVSPRLRQEQVELAEADIELLAAAGFRVTPKPDDNTRAPFTTSADRRRLAAMLATLDSGETASYDFTHAEMLRRLLALAEHHARLDGQPQDRPDRCPTCDSDDPDYCNTDGERHRLGIVISESCCTHSWHVGGSGDTR